MPLSIHFCLCPFISPPCRCGKVTSEDKKDDKDTLQTVYSELASVVCEGGDLVQRDTHAKSGPQGHPMDMSYVLASSFAAAEGSRVTFGELATLDEYKLDFNQQSQMDDVCVQLNDRWWEWSASQQGRSRFHLRIADKRTTRFFCFDQDGCISSSSSLPFLNLDENPTAGFTLYVRMMRSTPQQLGLASVTALDLPVGYTHYLVRQGAEKPTVYKLCQQGQVYALKVFADKEHAKTIKTVIQKLHSGESASKYISNVCELGLNENYLALTPYGITLEQAEFTLPRLKKAAAACGHAMNLAAVQHIMHGDPSPRNIIVATSKVQCYSPLFVS
jgi:hypothetical protein